MSDEQKSDERAAWLESRREFLGASEVPAVIGCAPGKTALEVWSQKRGRIVPTPDTPAMRMGRVLERPILDDYARVTGVALAFPGTLRHTVERWMGATPDAAVLADERPVRDVQCKVVGVGAMRRWGDEALGAEAVPDYVIAQVTWEMLVLGVVEADVVALICGTDPRVYRVPFDRALADLLVETCGDFWRRCVIGGEVPEDFDGSDSATRAITAEYPRVRRDIEPAPAEVVELARLYDGARAMASTAEAEKDRLGNALRVAIADRAGYGWDGGAALWREQRGRTDWRGLALEMGATPDLIAKHTPATLRVLDVRLKGDGK